MTESKNARVAAWRLRETDYQIAEAYEASEGEVTPEIEALEAFRDASREECLEALASYVQSETGWVATLDAEAKRIAEGKAAAKRRVEWAKGELLRLLGDEKGARVGSFEIKTRAGRKSVSIDPDLELEALPSQYIRTTTAPDKTAISKALKDGEEIPGCSLVVGPRSVSIKA